MCVGGDGRDGCGWTKGWRAGGMASGTAIVREGGGEKGTAVGRGRELRELRRGRIEPVATKAGWGELRRAWWIRAVGRFAWRVETRVDIIDGVKRVGCGVM